MKLTFEQYYQKMMTQLKEDAGGAMTDASVFSGHSGPNDVYAPGDSRNVFGTPRRKKRRKKRILRRRI